LLGQHAKYLNRLDKAIVVINEEIESMNNQNELQQTNIEKYNDKKEA
jgi:hypothetical protein